MWIYIKVDNNIFSVGFYDKEGKFKPESYYITSAAAAQRVNYLNGGKYNYKSDEQ